MRSGECFFTFMPNDDNVVDYRTRFSPVPVGGSSEVKGVAIAVHIFIFLRLRVRRAGCDPRDKPGAAKMYLPEKQAHLLMNE